MAYSPLGYSLPDLTVSGIAAPVAAYEGPLTVTVNVSNLGASSILEPNALPFGSPSHADAPASTVTVYLGSRPNFRAGIVPIGTIDIPAVPQNSLLQVTQTLTMPVNYPVLPDVGGTAYVFFRINPSGLDINRANNFTRTGQPLQIAPALPDVFATALAVPPVMQPGDFIQPDVKIANFGTVNTADQGPFLVDLVASTDQNFGPGDKLLASWTISNLPPLAQVPSTNTVLGDVTVNDPANVVTLTGPIVQLPDSSSTDPPTDSENVTPTVYYIGVIVDPDNAIQEISELDGDTQDPMLSPVVQVGPPINGLPPAGVLQPPTTPFPVFPYPTFVPTDSTTTGTTGTTTVSAAGTPTNSMEYLDALKNGEIFNAVTDQPTRRGGQRANQAPFDRFLALRAFLRG